MTEVELERLVIRLVGESSSYLKMLVDVNKKTQETVGEMEKHFSKIEKFKEKIEGFGESMKKTLLSIGITAGAKEALEKFEHAEKQSRLLEAALESNGREVSKLTDDYTKFAKEIAATTDTSKSLTMQMLREAETYGLTGEKAKQAVKDAMALAAIKDSDDPKQFLRMTSMFAHGKDSRLGSLLGIGNDMEGDETKTSQIRERLDKAQKLVAANGETTAAKLARASAAMGEVTKKVGEAIANVVVPVVGWIEKAATAFSALDPTVKTVVVTFALAVAAIEPLSIAYTFLAGRIAALGPVLLYVKQLIGTLVVTLIDAAGAFTMMGASAKVATVALGVTFVAALVALIVVIKQLREETEKFNKALEESGKLSEKIRAVQREKVEKSQHELGRIETLDDRRNAVKPQLEAAEKYRREREEAKNRAEENLKKVDEETTSGGRGSNFNSSYHLGRDAIIGSAPDAAKFAEAEQAAKDAKARFEEATEQEKRLRDMMAPDPKVVEQIEDLIAKYKDEAVTVGMTAAQIELYNAQKKLGSDHTLLPALREAQELAEMAKKTASATEDLKGFNEALKLQQDTFGMTAEQIKIYKAELAGVDQEIIKQARDLVNATNDQKAYWDMMAEGQALMDKFAPPLEKFNAEIEHAFELLDSQAIDEFTFFKVLEDAKKKFDDATKGAEQTKNAIQKVDAALSGGAEARTRMFNFANDHRIATEQTAIQKGFNPFGGPQGPAGFGKGSDAAMFGLMKRIADGIDAIKEKPTVFIENADLDEEV